MFVPSELTIMVARNDSDEAISNHGTNNVEEIPH